LSALTSICLLLWLSYFLNLFFLLVLSLPVSIFNTVYPMPCLSPLISVCAYSFLPVKPDSPHLPPIQRLRLPLFSSPPFLNPIIPGKIDFFVVSNIRCFHSWPVTPFFFPRTESSPPRPSAMLQHHQGLSRPPIQLTRSLSVIAISVV